MAVAVLKRGAFNFESGGLEFVDSSTTGVTIDTTTPLPGLTKSAVINSTSDVLVLRSASISTGFGYWCFHWRPSTLPSFDDRFLRAVGVGQDWAIDLKSDGRLELVDSPGTTSLDTSGAIISAGTWYAWHVWYKQANPGRLKIWIDEADSPAAFNSPTLVFAESGVDLSSGAGAVELHFSHGQSGQTHRVSDGGAWNDQSVGSTPHADMPIKEFRTYLAYDASNATAVPDWFVSSPIDNLDGGTIWSAIGDVPLDTSNAAEYTSVNSGIKAGGMTFDDPSTGGPLARPGVFNNAIAGVTWVYYVSRQSGFASITMHLIAGGNAIATTLDPNKVITSIGDPGTSVVREFLDASNIGGAKNAWCPLIDENAQAGFRAQHGGASAKNCKLHECYAAIVHIEKSGALFMLNGIGLKRG